MDLLDFLARWGHILFGICWIGLLYYFNFVQTEYFKEADGDARADVVSKLVPDALWWFRWAAMFTFLTGLVMLGVRGAAVSLDITLGAVMGTLMFLNVWLIIWPNQKIVIASTQQVKAGGEALPDAAGAAPKAGLASRTNTLLSIPMLFFMASSVHLSSAKGLGHGMIGDASMAALGVGLAIIAAVEINGIVGKQGPMTTVRGVITSGLALTGVLWAVVALL